MSKQLFINNANAVPAASASVDEPGELAEGRIGVWDADDMSAGTLSFDAVVPNATRRIIIGQGAKTGEEPIISPILDLTNIERVFEAPYVAPVAQVSTVTAATGTGYATVRIIRADTGYRPEERITVEVKLDGKADTVIATELKDLIEAQNKDWITATTSSADLILTADTGVSFQTALDDEAEDWTLDATTSPKYGTGTSDQLSNLEEIAWGANYTNRIYLPVTPPSYVVDGETYDLFTILYRTNTTANISKSNKYFEIILAVQATASGIDFDEFFNGSEALSA